MSDIKLRQCTVCQIEKPETEFYKMTKTKLHGRCKVCYKQMRKRFYEENKHTISMKYSVGYYKKTKKTS